MYVYMTYKFNVASILFPFWIADTLNTQIKKSFLWEQVEICKYYSVNSWRKNDWATHLILNVFNSTHVKFKKIIREPQSILFFLAYFKWNNLVVIHSVHFDK